MKKLSLILMSLLLSFGAVSCSNNSDEIEGYKKKIEELEDEVKELKDELYGDDKDVSDNDQIKAATVKVTIEADGNNILKDYEIKVEGVDGNAPTAMDAILSALDSDCIAYETSMLHERVLIEKIDEFDTEDYAYLWELVINDSKKTSSLKTEIMDGDKLVLTRNPSAIE